MGTRICSGTCSIGLVIVSAGVSGATAAERKIFILEKANQVLLCGYTSEHEWAQVPKEKDVEFTAIVDSTDGLVTHVLVQRFTEDTTAYDEYAVGKDGIILRLKRTLDVVPDRITREQIWDIRGGRAVKVSEAWMEFKTHKARSPDKDIEDLVENPIIVGISDFPFSALMMDKRPEGWQGGSRCVPGDMNKLEADSRK